MNKESKKITKKNSIKLNKSYKSKKKMDSLTYFTNIEYPYYNQTITKDELFKNVKKLKKFNPINLKRNPIRKIKIKKFNNEYVVFLEDYNKYKNLYNITDYFSQECRVRCVYNSKDKKSILEQFTENKQEILNKLVEGKKLNHHNLTEYLYSNYKQCTNFNTTIVISILKLFKPKKYLDMSAGWGDRLIGAISYGCQYTGVDPSECMENKYKKIIKTLVPAKYRKDYKVIKSGFETVELPENEYDLMFSSPPFFTLELYEKTENQSSEKFDSLQKWEEGFLYPSIEKTYKCLKNGGHMALYIDDYTNTNYIDKMKKYIEKEIPNFEYKGDIHWWNITKKNKIRKIFVWQKIN